MDIRDSIKEMYYYLEDKYYSFLDRVNEVVPVYKIVDPIDRIVPSFVFFVILAISLLGFLTFSFVLPWLSQGAGLGPFSAQIRVSTEDGAVIAGASVSFAIEGKQGSAPTDPFGIIKITLPKETAQAQISVSKEGYNPESKELLLKHNNLYTIILLGITRPPAQLQPVLFNVFLIDRESRRPITGSATLTFSCSAGTTPPSPITRIGGEFKDIQMPANCGELLVSISAQGYEPKSGERLDRPQKFIELTPTGLDAVGNIRVNVVDTNNQRIAGADVKLFGSNGVLVNQKQTTTSGNALFEKVRADTYKITALFDGRFAERLNVRVDAGETLELSITLPPKQPVVKKIFLKILDTNSNLPVGDARVNVFANRSFFDARNSGSDGLVTITPVPASLPGQGISFVAVITHQNYLMKIVEIAPLDGNSSAPTEIPLNRFVPAGAGAVTVNVIDSDTNGPVQGATVLLFNTDFNGIILNYPFSLSSEQGQVFFTKLPITGNYFSTATKSNQFGHSESKPLVAGQAVSLNIFLVFVQGRLQITVKDNTSKSAVQRASVSIHNFANSSLMETGLANDNGVFDSAPIDTDKTVYIIVRAASYLGSASYPITLARGVKRVEVLLFRDDFQAPVCGNRACDPGETTDNCSSDCGQPVCGDRVCAIPESPGNCRVDCGNPPVCGNRVCEDTESPLVCSQDCGQPPIRCSDNTCGAGENKQNCPQDCGFPPPVCGDRICTDREFPTTCPLDCGNPPLPARNVFGMEFAGFFSDSEARTKARVLESERTQPKQYFAKWNLFLPANKDYNALTGYFRFGVEGDANIQATGYRIKAKGNVRSTPFSSVMQGKCYSTQTDFTSIFLIPGGCIADPGQDARQVNVSWSNPFSKIALTVIVPVLIEQGLVDGVEIDLRYQYRGIFDGNYFQTQKFSKQFKIGVPLCTPRVDCPAFLWKFLIENPDLRRAQLFSFSPATRFAMESRTDYNITAEARNTSGNDFSGVDLNVQNKNPAGALSFPRLGLGPGPHTLVAGITIPEDAALSFPPVTVRSSNDTDITELLFYFNLPSSLEDTNKTLFFSVLPGKNLVIQLATQRLNPFDDSQKVQGFVRDANGLSPLGNALVKVFVQQVQEPLGTATTDANGFFSVPLNLFLSPGQVVMVEASKSGYKTASARVSVSGLRFLDPRYNCITVDQNSFSVALRQNFDFLVRSTNCAENVEIKLNTSLVSSPELVTLNLTDSKVINVTAASPAGFPALVPGIYPVFVQARFASDARFVNAFLAKVIVSDPNSCFVLNKHSFDLERRKSDKGTITNTCAVAFADVWLPELSIASREVLLKNLDSNLPATVMFDWRIDVRITTADLNVSVERVFREGSLLKSLDTGQRAGSPADTFDGSASVNLVGEEIRNVKKIRFESVAYTNNFCGQADTSKGYIKDGKFTVDTQAFTVPCDANRGCQWRQTLAINSRVEEAASKASCGGFYPCQYSYVEVDAGSLASLGSISANVHNESNCAFLAFSLFGEVGRLQRKVNIIPKEKSFTMGPFPVTIVPARHKGLVLGGFSYNINNFVDQNDSFVIEAELLPKSSDQRVETWIVDGRVFGKFVGKESGAADQTIDFELENVSLSTTKFSVLEVDDYVRQLR